MTERTAPDLAGVVVATVLDFQSALRRRLFEREFGSYVPPLSHDLERLRDPDGETELMAALERLIALGPEELELEAMAPDVVEVLVAAYGRRLGPWGRTVDLRAGLPAILRTLPRVASVLRLVKGHSVAWILRESPLAPLATCAILGLLDRLNVLAFVAIEAQVQPSAPPPELARPLVPRTADPLFRARVQLAQSLRAFQANESRGETGFSAWARCPFVSVPAPVPPDPAKSAAVVVMVDAVDAPFSGLIDAGDGWRSAEVVARELTAYVFHVPAGRATLTMDPYWSKGFRREMVCCAGEVRMVRVHPAWRGWRVEERVWGW